MSSEFHKVKIFQESLSEWQELDISAKKSLITELGEMAIEAAQSNGAFAGACNAAANLLFAVDKFSELSTLIREFAERSE